jgi:hypothetical protein
MNAQIAHFRTRNQLRASVAIGDLYTAQTVERLRTRGDAQGEREAAAIEALVELAREFLDDV